MEIATNHILNTNYVTTQVGKTFFSSGDAIWSCINLTWEFTFFYLQDTRQHIPQDYNFHSHCHENLKSHIFWPIN